MDANLSTAAASAIKQTQVQNEVNYAVAAKVQQANKEAGDAAVQLVKQAEGVMQQISKGHIDVQL